jgi:GntR family transcriptional repressor for pyruvate dehydrogenase complex
MASVLRPVRRAKAYDLASEQIKELITDGTWGPGDKLPSEKLLAEQLAISRGSVREALRMLEALGWLEIRPGEGTVVKQKVEAGPTAAVSDVEPPQEIDLGDLWEARKVIEPRAAYLAAERCVDSDLTEIENLLNRAERLIQEDDWGQALRLNPDFHLAVTKASGNKVLARLQHELARLERAVVVSEGEPDYSLPRAVKVLSEHRAIWKAVRSNRPDEAEQAMFQHLLDSWMAKWRRP